jgi:hypothetical protein
MHDAHIVLCKHQAPVACRVQAAAQAVTKGCKLHKLCNQQMTLHCKQAQKQTSQ